MVGLRTDAGPGSLILTPRPYLVAALVALTFVARLGFLTWRARRSTRRIVAGNRRLAEAITRSGRLLAPALLVFAITLPLFGGRFYLDLGIVVLTYVMLGWGLNIVVGLAGLLDLGYVAFYAVGAYSYAIFSTHYGLGFWTCLPIAGVLAAFAGMLLGFPVLRLRGDYLAIVTLAFGEIIRIVLINWSSLTNGPNGISDIPRPTLFGLTFDQQAAAPPASPASSVSTTAQPSGSSTSTTSSWPWPCSPTGSASASAACPSAAPGKPCARTKSPAAASASTSPSPS